jgi:hypothetical protein
MNWEKNALATLKEFLRTVGFAIQQIIKAGISPRIKGINFRAGTPRHIYDGHNT